MLEVETMWAVRIRGTASRGRWGWISSAATHLQTTEQGTLLAISSRGWICREKPGQHMGGVPKVLFQARDVSGATTSYPHCVFCLHIYFGSVVISLAGQVSSCTKYQDAVCQARTVCDPSAEYVLRRGDVDHDNLCALRTFCTRASARAMFEQAPATDSPDFWTNGTDSVCAPFTLCLDGTFQSFPGDDTHDAGCSPCPVGTYRNASLFALRDGGDETIMRCETCPQGTFASREGSVLCEKCSSCTSIAACPFTPAEKHCVSAPSELCTARSDTKCMACPSLSSEGGFMVSDGICVACRPGDIPNDPFLYDDLDVSVHTFLFHACV